MRHLPTSARAVLAWMLVTALGACTDSPTSVPSEGVIDLAAPWSTVEPSLVGMDAQGLEAASRQAGAVDRFRSLLVVRRGRLVLEQYFGGTDESTLADVRSVTKSVVSTLTGIALQRRHLDRLDQPIGETLRPPAYQLTEAQASVTIRHLLSMTGGFDWESEGSGQYNEWIRSGDHVGYLLDRPMASAPGSTFVYNSAAVHLLGVVLEEATGRDLPDFAQSVLFGPLGIGPTDWEELPGGFVNGGAGIDLRPRDLARFGQLMLQEGWSGTRSVVPSEWVREATATWFGWTIGLGPLDQVSYGFLWWTDLERDAYFAWGFGGQFIYVYPNEDLVVVATTDWRGLGEPGPRPLEEAAMEVIVSGVLGAIQ